MRLLLLVICLAGFVSACSRSEDASDVRVIEPAPPLATTAPVASPTPGPPPSPTPFALPTPTPSPTPLPVESRTLVFSGDVLSHTPVIAQAQANGASSGWAYDYRPMFAQIRNRLIDADLAICVLETPVSPDNSGLAGYPTFNAPRELPDALIEAGYAGCSTASNHSMDRGPTGVRGTLAEMDRVGLGHAGMARTEQEASNPRLYALDGVDIAHLSYTYGLNGFVLPEDEPWLVNLNEVAAIVNEAGRAREAGADFVVLSIQWGNEYQRDPSAEQRELARAISASGVVDLIVGNHVHVVQPIDFVGGIPVIYGLGNSLSNQSDNCCRVGTQDGVMIEVTVSGNERIGFEATNVAFAPTWVDRTDYTIIDLIHALADPALDPNTRVQYEASFERTAEAIASLGSTAALAS